MARGVVLGATDLEARELRRCAQRCGHDLGSDGDLASADFVQSRAARAGVQRVVDLYQAWDARDPGRGHGDEADRWLDLLEDWD